MKFFYKLAGFTLLGAIVLFGLLLIYTFIWYVVALKLIKYVLIGIPLSTLTGMLTVWGIKTLWRRLWS